MFNIKWLDYKDFFLKYWTVDEIINTINNLQMTIDDFTITKYLDYKPLFLETEYISGPHIIEKKEYMFEYYKNINVECNLYRIKKGNQLDNNIKILNRLMNRKLL